VFRPDVGDADGCVVEALKATGAEGQDFADGLRMIEELLKSNPKRLRDLKETLRRFAKVPGKPRFLRHNRKVRGLTWSLPTGVTCVETCHYCYARKAEIRHKAVLPHRLRNLLHSLKPSEVFIEEMVADLSKRIYRDVRIHVSGDFYSTRYAFKILRIAERLPDFHFWTYTRLGFPLWSSGYLQRKPANFKVLYSLPGIRARPPTERETSDPLYKGYDGVAWIADGVHVWGSCPAIMDHSLKCGRDCRMCMDGKEQVVSFTLH